jgi:hypothetical protein
MSGEINWKQKYQEVKAKWLESLDMAFRAGFEQGQQQEQQNNMMQQQQQAQEMQNAALQGQGGAPGEEAEPNDGTQQDPSQPAGPGQGVQPPDSENPQGSELDQHIAKLESMVNKSEETEAVLSGLKAMKKSFEFQNEMKKSVKAIPEIAKALHRPAFKMSQQANHNLSSSAKSAVTMQEKIVNDVMQKWEAEEKKAGKDILAQLGIENLTKKEE